MWTSWQTWYIIRQPEKAVCRPYLVEVCRLLNFDQQGLRHEATENSKTTIIK